MVQTIGANVSIDRIPVGFTCTQDIHEATGQLLLSAGETLTRSIRDNIVGRGIASLFIPDADVTKIDAGTLAVSRPKQAVASLSSRRAERSKEPYSAERSERYRKQSDAVIQVISHFGTQFESISSVNLSALCGLPTDLTEMLLEDADQATFALSQCCESQHADNQDTQSAGVKEQALAQRCALMSMLAINTAIEMKLADKDVVNVGLAGLLHDIGLFQMPDKMRDSTAVLSDDDAWEYRHHPVALSNALSGPSIVSDEVRAIAAQVHERPDGSGYPRGIRGNLLHPLSKILHVVDSYLTLVSPGPGRPKVLPHDAMTFLLVEGQRGLFDAKVMRAFITHITLFPIGSSVRLNDGRTGTVIRRDQGHFANPIVRLHGMADDEAIATSQAEYSISGPFVDSAQPHMRLAQNDMQSLYMSDFDRCS